MYYTYVKCSTVTDIIECASNPCENGATCKDDVNAYMCSCMAGFTGYSCESGTFQDKTPRAVVNAAECNHGRPVVAVGKII